MPSREKLAEFVAWCQNHITGDEKGQAQIFLDRLFQAFGQAGSLDVGGHPEFRIRKADEDGGGTAFADYVWKAVVLIEMKKRGTDLQKHYRQAFDYWSRLVPNRPRYVVLCNFDEFRVYDFDTDLDAPKDTVTLKDLPERWGPLAFLAPGNPKPNFENDRVAVTTQFEQDWFKVQPESFGTLFQNSMAQGRRSEDFGQADEVRPTNPCNVFGATC